MTLNIIDIAKLAGVSKSTVSRYLNNGYVGTESREKIKKIIEETGFMPQSHAKSLRTGKTNLIGVIVPKISTETAPRVVQGITEVLSENNYDVLIANTNLSVEKEFEYLNIFKNNQVDGVIFMGTKITPKHRKIMDKLNVPIVVVAQYMDNYPCVYHDDFNAAKYMTEYLIGKGHKNIGFIGVYEEDRSVGLERKNGYIAALNENDLEVDIENLKLGDFSYESGYELAKKLIKKKNIPTAIFAVTDNLAIATIDCLKDNGLNVPEDVAVVSIGDTRISQVVSPKLTTIHYYYKTSGRKSGEIMLELLKNGIKTSKTIKKNIKLSYRLIERNSV